MADEAGQPAKFSRYRSVRKAQQAQAPHMIQASPPVPDIPQETSGPESSVSRSMSRYHRQRPAPKDNSLPQRANTTQQRSHSDNAPASVPIDERPRTRSDAAAYPPRNETSRRERNAAVDAKDRARLDSPHQRRSNDANVRPVLREEEEERAIRKEQRRAERSNRKEATDAIEQYNKKVDAARDVPEEPTRRKEEPLLMKAKRNVVQPEANSSVRRLQKPMSPPDTSHGGKDNDARLAVNSQGPDNVIKPSNSKSRFGFFHRHKSEDNTKSSEAFSPQRTAFPGTMTAGASRPEAKSAPPLIKPGDRRVLVEVGKSSINLPVTPTTTPYDLVKSAATCLTEPIEPRTAVLQEFFGKVGVTRPLRRYEHVKDVLNSWDSDDQNPLIIIPGDNEQLAHRLAMSSAASIPEDKPDKASWWLYYSQKPGKWSKRYITLNQNGQITLAKAENSLSKDISTICHLTEFDIFQPTKKQQDKKIKPPKKVCYAIKSQRKSTMFLDTSSFVHFFCTNDRRTAEDFYAAVHAWRSWHLVHVLGEGQRPTQEPAAEKRPASHEASTPIRQKSQRHQSKPSTGSLDSHYQLGSFKPLLDMQLFTHERRSIDETPRRNSSSNGRPGSGGNGPDTKALFQHKMSLRQKSHPPLSGSALFGASQEEERRPSSSSGNQPKPPAQEPESPTFAPTGLLGRSYSQRRREQEERDLTSNNPFTEGPSLLNTNNPSLARSGSTRSNKNNQTSHGKSMSSDLKDWASVQRAKSTRHGPKPLIDLTPQYKEPPQHARKGKGYHPDNGYPLVESATSPDEAIQIPPSVDWRGRNVVNAPPTTSHGRPQTSGGRERSRSNAQPPDADAFTGGGLLSAPPPLPSNPVHVSEDAFTGSGLLAAAGPSQGGSGRGHGVLSGNQAKGPMLELNIESQFAPGSLLRQVEKDAGPTAPVISRMKGREVDAKVGEGY